MTRGEKERRVLRKYLLRLADSRANGAAQLAFCGEWTREEIDRLDLTGVVELKRGSNGVFEAKFVDPLRVLDMLRGMESRESGAEEFLAALAHSAEEGET